jgi:polyribonucleotide nucleotidyltransferase
MSSIYSTNVGNREIVIDTGKLAKLAGGSAVVKMGDSVVLATACMADKPREGADFIPLVVDYLEKTFAAGKIPGGFFKREGRPSEHEILTSRLIDRSIRPLLPKGFYFDTQIITTVMSLDNDNPTDVMALVGASVALSLSEIPFNGPIAAVRVARINSEHVVNPSLDELEKSSLNIIVAGSSEGITMVEGDAMEVPEEEVLDAIMYGWEQLIKIIDLQRKMKEEIGKTKISFDEPDLHDEIKAKIDSLAVKSLHDAFLVSDKLRRREKIAAVWDEVKESFTEEEILENGALITSYLRDIEKKLVRDMLLEKKKRIDDRGPQDIREIWSEAGVLPRAHGSAIFTRGETQVLVATTLGTEEDEQRVDALTGETSKRFMLHYNFPPYSVGEVRFLRTPARREIGHGVLAEKAISKVLPTEEEFPYTLRVVSEVLESNGSSSMATVCGASLSLMDAGVPIKAPVGGIAMGLITEGDETVILSDILGDEDHLGEMDFKVAGTERGVTAIQMDIKVERVSREILSMALSQAREGRLFIIDKMNSVIDKPRDEISKYAPRLELIMVKPDKIREIIGPQGKTIRGIIEQTGVKIDVEDDGTVKVYAVDEESVKKAIDIIKELTQEAEIGKSYAGKVKKIMDFGAFVEIFPGTEGLLHISQISHKRIKAVSDVLRERDEVRVKVLDIDGDGKIRLSRKDLIRDEDDTRPTQQERTDRKPYDRRGKDSPRK